MAQLPKIYIAAPLFSDAEKAFNLQLKEALNPFFQVFLPQEDGGLVADMIKTGQTPDAVRTEVFQMDIEAMNSCQLLLIVLDGRSIDEGAAFELGYVYSAKKPCIGLQTDVRRLMPEGNNPMIEGACKHIFKRIDELLRWAVNFSLV